jgi:hypothetical protein
MDMTPIVINTGQKIIMTAPVYQAEIGMTLA